MGAAASAARKQRTITLLMGALLFTNLLDQDYSLGSRRALRANPKKRTW